MHFDGRAVAAVLHRPAAKPRRPEVVEAVRQHIPFLLGPRGHHRGLHQHVGPTFDQQVGRRLFTNDGDGNAWGDKVVGFPPVLDKLGYKLTDPGRFQDLTDDFSAQIAAFRQSEVEIVTGVVIPPDFTTFWNQANQKGFKPKIASVGKALLFPVALEALGKSGANLSTEVWWTPTSLQVLADWRFRRRSRQGIRAGERQGVDAADRLRSRAVRTRRDSLKRSADAGDPKANVEAIGKSNLDTIVGKIAFGNPALPAFAQKNIAKTPLVGGQWRLRDGGKYEIVVVDNQTASASRPPASWRRSPEAPEMKSNRSVTFESVRPAMRRRTPAVWLARTAAP